MTSNVVQIVQGALKPEVTAAVAERLGEPAASVAAALEAVVPGVFQLLGARAAEPGGPESLLAAMRASGAAFSLNDPLSRLTLDGAGAETVLGDDGQALGRRAADFAGVGEAAGAALVGMVTPLALGALARTAPPPLNAETLLRTLREQANGIDRALPPGFTLGAPERAPEAAAATPSPPADDREQVEVADRAAAFAGPQVIPPVQPPAASPRADVSAGESRGLPKWALLLLALLVLLVLAFIAMRVTDGRILGGASGEEAEPAAAESAPPGEPG